MKRMYNRPYHYRLTRPPKALLKAKLDNIAIVPASMLPLTDTLKEKVNTLPKGGVFLCYAEANSRQRKLLERVEEIFREHGHPVMHLSMGEVETTKRNWSLLLDRGVVDVPLCHNRKAGHL
jgi:hypothetical protein